MTKDEALKLALEALKMNPLDTPTNVYDTKYQKAIDVAKEALAQPEQERVNRYCRAGMCVESDKLHEVGCTAHRSPPLPVQPERPWVGLTDEDKQNLAAAQLGWEELIEAVDAKLKEKNT